MKKQMKKTKLNHRKLAWVCDNCNFLTISDSKEHHKMDTCPCGQCGVDLEEYCCRFSFGDKAMPRVIAQLKEGDKWRYVKQCKKKLKSKVKNKKETKLK